METISIEQTLRSNLFSVASHHSFVFARAQVQQYTPSIVYSLVVAFLITSKTPNTEWISRWKLMFMPWSLVDANANNAFNPLTRQGAAWLASATDWFVVSCGVWGGCEGRSAMVALVVLGLLSFRIWLNQFATQKLRALLSGHSVILILIPIWPQKVGVEFLVDRCMVVMNLSKMMW